MNYSEFIKAYAAHPEYRSPVGAKLHALSWQTEAPLRMLLNNLNREVAENPSDLIVYGGTGQAARNPEALKDIIRILLTLREDQSLLVQSGKPAGIIRSHPEAPRVLIANSNLVPAWANWEYFNQLKERGLIMYGQMTAGSWIYIGSQGILQGTYETFAECGRKYFNGKTAGKLLVSGGLGGMGGAQPLAATMAGYTFLGVDIDPARIKKRIHTKYIDKMTSSYAEAKKLVMESMEKRTPVSIGLVGNIGDVLEQLLHDGLVPDVLTDQTSAHDPVNGYVPAGITLQEALSLRKSNPSEYRERSLKSMARHVRFMLNLKERGSVVFDYGNNLREFARLGGEKDAFGYQGFVPEFIRPLFCEGKGPFRWVALSGDPEDILVTDDALKEAFPGNKHLINWLDEAERKISCQGLPARICWLGMGEREKAGLIFNKLVKTGKVKAPVVIGRDHLDCGSVASPYRETEGMKDGSDAVSDWPLLNLMANTSGGATWVSFHHGGGVGIGYSQHAGMVVVADGSKRAENCLKRVLHNDPAMGIFRHADAGYEEAQKKQGKVWIMNKPKLIGPFRQILTMDQLPVKGPLSDDKQEIIGNAGIIVRDGVIESIGPYRDLKNPSVEIENTEDNLVVMPGMIDVHTHLCWAGSRAGDYALRLSGKTYLEIATAGGGIWSTVTKTRAADLTALADITSGRAQKMLKQGITTIEVKSGYGLEVEAELKILRSIHEAQKRTSADLVPTCLAAHIKPRDFEGSPRAYLQNIISDLLPMIKKEKLANRVDIYVDEGAFSAEDARFYLKASLGMGFDVSIHADQFYPGGLELAIEIGAVSADHLEASDLNDVKRLALSNVIPVALPGASLGLAAKFAPARKILDSGASLAIASDWNPGSAPMGKLLTQAAVLGVFEKLTMTETLAAITFRAAPVLKLSDRGILRPGMLADFIAFPCADWRDILYYQGALEPVQVWKRGTTLSGEAVNGKQ